VLVEATLDDFLAEAEEEGEEPIRPAVGLVELAAVAISRVVLRHSSEPQQILDMVVGRAATILYERVERRDVLRRPSLRVVTHGDG
jgi:hypothetical protein